MSKFPRAVLPKEKASKTVDLLQGCLVDLIDLALQLKQAHWNVVGPLFQAVHEKLDAIIDTARAASDEVAERIITIGTTADGRAATIVEASRLKKIEAGFADVAKTVTTAADRVFETTTGLRTAIEATGDLDPISQDMLIGITAELEKHLWMLQAQEIG